MKRRAAVLLALVMTLLTACGGAKTEERKQGVFYDATGLSPDAMLLTVDRRDVTAERYFYWLAYTCDYISDTYEDIGAAVKWEETLSGETLGDYARQQALDNTVLYATVENWAEQYGCQLTEEDQGAIDAEWAARVQEHGSEEAYLAVLAAAGLDKAGAQLLAADRYLYLHLYDLYCTPGSALYPAAEVVEEHAAQQGYLTVDHIFLSAADEAAMPACRTKAEEVLARAKAGSDFAVLAEQYSEDDRTDYPDGYTFLPGTGVHSDAFEAAAKALGENQLSGVVDADSGCYLILRKPLDLEAVSGSYFESLLQAAADRADITYSDEWEDLTVSGFYDGLTAARKALAQAQK